MKKMLIGLMIVALASPVLAVEKSELDQRIHALTTMFDAMQSKVDKQIPADVLSKAHGIILLERTKAGFLFAYQGGGGVALVKDAKTGKWSPAAFLSANEASLGFQIGGEHNFFVILLMNTNATRLLTDSSFEFGGEARGTAGNQTGGAEGTVSSTEKPVLVYDDRKGLYGQFVTMKDILFDKKVKPTETAIKLAEKITEYSKVAKKK